MKELGFLIDTSLKPSQKLSVPLNQKEQFNSFFETLVEPFVMPQTNKVNPEAPQLVSS